MPNIKECIRVARDRFKGAIVDQELYCKRTVTKKMRHNWLRTEVLWLSGLADASGPPGDIGTPGLGTTNDVEPEWRAKCH